MENWTKKNIEKLIENINRIELLVKKNSDTSINIIQDFILQQSTTTSN